MVWGKTGPAHSFPPPKCSDLSIYLLDFRIRLFFCCIWTLLTYTKQRIKFSTVYWYFNILGWGKDWAGPFFPPPKCFDHSFYLSVFWIMLLFHCILTLMNILFERENQVFKPNSLFVLLHCGVGKDWVGPFFPPSKMFRSFYLSFSLLDYATLWLYLNNFEWPIPKWELSFQTNKFIGTSTLWGGERLGRPILYPLQNVLIFLFII